MIVEDKFEYYVRNVVLLVNLARLANDHNGMGTLHMTSEETAHTALSLRLTQSADILEAVCHTG